MARNNALIVVMGAVLSVASVQVTASGEVGEIKRVEGSAMISQGEHFVAAQAGMKLQELDRLMVLEQSQATLEFKDGCRYVLQEREMLTVGPNSACVDSPKTAATTDYSSVERTATSQLAPQGPDVGLAIYGVLALTGIVYGVSNTGDGDPIVPFSPR